MFGCINDKKSVIFQCFHIFVLSKHFVQEIFKGSLKLAKIIS